MVSYHQGTEGKLPVCSPDLMDTFTLWCHSLRRLLGQGFMIVNYLRSLCAVISIKVYVKKKVKVVLIVSDSFRLYYHYIIELSGKNAGVPVYFLLRILRQGWTQVSTVFVDRTLLLSEPPGNRVYDANVRVPMAHDPLCRCLIWLDVNIAFSLDCKENKPFS